MAVARTVGKAASRRGDTAPAKKDMSPWRSTSAKRNPLWTAFALHPGGVVPGLQAKLRVGAIDDPLEREADQVADQVMRMPAPGSAARRPAISQAAQVRRTPADEVIRRQEPESEQEGESSLCIKSIFGGEVMFEGLPAAVLGDIAVINEETGGGLTTPVANGVWYDCDGFWYRPRSQWFKIPDHCRVEVHDLTPSHVSYTHCCNWAASLFKAGPHWTSDGLDESKQNPFLADQSTEVIQRTCDACADEDEEELQRSSESGGGAGAGATAPDSVHATLRTSGNPLDADARAFFEPRFSRSLADVRVHTDAQAATSARNVQADAYTVGQHLVFAPGLYTPNTDTGRRLLAHELTHVVQQGGTSPLSVSGAVSTAGPGEPVIRRSNAADPRLPLDQAEALSFAGAAKTAIDAANTRLGAATDPRDKNVPGLIAQRGITLAALTPRHDSAAPTGRINFFAGQVDYSDSVELPERATHHINAARDAARIRARQHANVDNMLTGPEIEERLVQAVSEIASTAAARSGAPNPFDLYRAQFNALWETAAFAGLAASFDATLSSKGPRTPRSRAIFDQIYADDAAVKAAYDANTGGIRERIDAYVGPEGLNLINSPRLQSLRAAFFPFTAPIPSASYTAFRTAVQSVAATLDQADRDAVDSSNDWQRLINAHVTAQDKRDEIRTIIRTPPAAPAATPPAAPSATPGAAPATGGTVTPQTFVDSISIDGPSAPVLANERRERVTLTPRSTVANPNVAISTRFTVTPTNRVQGASVSPASVWPNAANAGTSFAPEIINTSTVTMTAHLDLVNGPSGLAPATPIPDLPFTVQDNRKANFIATWFAAVNFNTGAGQDWFDPLTSTPHYRGGTQTFNVGGFLSSPQTNPGLSVFIKTRLKRGAAIVAAPGTLEAFPPDADQTTLIPINIPAPASVPATGDPLDFEIELIDADRTTVLNTQTISMSVGPEATYTRAQAITAAAVDDSHFHDNSATGLLGQMTALGGAPATVAAAINAPATAPRLTLRPLTVRHDSAAYVAAVTGGPNPSMVGYFVGSSYNNAPPDTTHSFADVAGAAAFHVPSGFGPRFIVANRTIDVASATKRADAELIPLIVHEAVHAMDERPGAGTTIERYKTEFRAYWMDGRWGPPNLAVCPPPVTPFSSTCPPAGATCYDTMFRPELPPPGPKSCRARAIFGQMLYGSTTYPFVKPAYDNNTAGFRDAVDSYLIPDGINLIVSVRLEALRQLIAGFTGGGFTAFRSNVQGFMGVGTAPALGALNADERNEVQRNRAWRDLVNSTIANTANRVLIKTDLGIPT